MSKEQYKYAIANKRVTIVSLRAKIVKVKGDKKRRMEDLSKKIKISSSPSNKESYRKSKITESARYDREVDSIKKKIEGVKKEIESLKKNLARLK